MLLESYFCAAINQAVAKCIQSSFVVAPKQASSLQIAFAISLSLSLSKW